MKYSEEERLNIGKEIYNGEYNANEAAVKYGVNYYTARGYLRLYKASIADDRLQVEQEVHEAGNLSYAEMSKEALYYELMRILIEQEVERIGKEYSTSIQGRYKIIEALCDRFSIMSLCKKLGVSRSGYYKYKRREYK